MPQNQIAAYETLGNLPPRMSVLRTLNEQGKLKQGDVLLEQAAVVEPLIAQGTPGWYPQFSTAVASAINRAAKGQLSVDDAITAIAKAAEDAQATNRLSRTAAREPGPDGGA